MRMVAAGMDCITSTAGNDAAERIVLFSLKAGWAALAKRAVQLVLATADGL